MDSNARSLLSVNILLDPFAANLEVRINDGCRPWVLTHDFQRYLREGPLATAQYLAKRYLVSRPDQLRFISVPALSALLLAALEEHELRDACA
ncbi:hypothetical protein [Solirubrum puertoriconensis]|uniref:Uncharacterized protein n=1 Tax=Solirubrum puertoriconensis TaxID=1751427 RepID=A0A9X0HN36_SOLP1|nr:hypothetical protein [Solirubrum puertoriconensis]KUG09016.1 hypothetical protein ASU33_19525 [Solirubrum puertoriconensis]